MTTDGRRQVHSATTSLKRTIVDIYGDRGGYLFAKVTVAPAALRFLAPALITDH
jgi:hypothetical protein